MASDARKHTVPVGTDPVDLVAVVGGLSASIRDVIQVDNTTARAALVDALTTAGIGPTTQNPLYVHRSDATPGRELETTKDGTNWYSIPTGRTFQSGVATLAGDATNQRSVAVPFPVAFATTPLVMLQGLTGQTLSSTTWNVWPSNETPTGFSLNGVRNNTTTMSVRWLAFVVA
jgi:hypothetical protein